MNQVEYEQIIECIRFGAPAYANKLIAAFNSVVQLAAKYSEVNKQNTPNNETASEDK